MLSEHFSIAEYVRSQSATRHGIDNSLPADLLQDAIWFAQNVLEPVRELLGKPMIITSGYRCPALNARIGGSDKSYHSRALAADFVVTGMLPFAVATKIKESDIVFDKLIHEFGEWCHIQGRRDDLRVESLTARKVEGRTVYEFGINLVA